MASGLDYFIIVFYFGILILAGYIGSKKAKTTEDFAVGGRSFPMWVFFPVLVTVIIGGGATFGGAERGFLHGISGAWMVTMFGVGILGLGFLVTTKISNLKVLSLSEMLGLRYDKNSQLISALISAIYTAMIAVNAIIAVGTTISSLFSIPLVTAILIGGSIALLYTFAGGMRSLAITDVLQFLLMTIGVFFLLIPIGLSKIGGFSAITQTLDPVYLNPFHIGWTSILSFFLLFSLGLMIGQDIWQRVFTAKTTKIAKYGTISAGIYTILWSVAMAMIGLIGLVLIPGLESSQSVLPEVIITVMPTGLQGLVLAGILSALISTFTGTTLASSTLIVNDLIAPSYSKNLTAKKHLLLSRMTTLAVGIVVLLLAVVIQDVLTALDTAYALLSGSLFVPIMAGFFWKKANWQGALSSIIASTLVVLGIIIFTGETTTTPIMFGILTSVIVMVVVSLATSPTPKSQMDEWENRIGNPVEIEE